MCPVPLVTDAHWDFVTILASNSNLAYDTLVPEFIIADLAYAGESLDEADFLRRIQHVSLPQIEQNYRREPELSHVGGQVMGGRSLEV